MRHKHYIKCSQRVGAYQEGCDFVEDVDDLSRGFALDILRRGGGCCGHCECVLLCCCCSFAVGFERRVASNSPAEKLDRAPEMSSEW
jgi:hypothetical protein